MSQLNSNTLLSPLLYTTNNNSQSTSSSPSQQNGLPSQTQAQQADDFIRYATGSIVPLELPSQVDYQNLYTRAINTDKGKELDQKAAQATLTNYLANVRTYAAQTSVGIANLYYMLSRRMPQKLPNGEMSSEALSEFNMASWRLFNPAQSSDKAQWLSQLNQASSATVQKEIATLLAEINYQLYLSRQQNERLLLTQTILLLQNAKASQPTATSLRQSGQE